MKDYILWAIHPKYLDNFAIKSCWNDAVSIKNIIMAKGHHDILRIFERGQELEQIKSYLFFLHIEGLKRGLEFESTQVDQSVYRFAKKIGDIKLLRITESQLKKERRIYLGELKKRDRHKFYQLIEHKKFEQHLSFKIEA